MDPPGLPDQQDQQVRVLLDQGALGEAAALLRQRGALLRAQQLYERLWDFRSAAEVARERHDQAAVLRLLLEARDVAGAEQVYQALLHGEPAQQAGAAVVLEQRQRWDQAAPLREALGELGAARGLFERAQLPLEVARLSERLGEPQRAREAYEAALGPDAAAHDRQRAHLGLGRLLQRFGQHEDAVRHLQAARRALLTGDAGGAESARTGPVLPEGPDGGDGPEEEDRALGAGLEARRRAGASPSAPALDEIDRLLVRGLSGLRYPEAAVVVLERLQHRRGERVPPLDEFLSDDTAGPGRREDDPRSPANTGLGDEPMGALGAGSAHRPAQGEQRGPPTLLSRYEIVRLLGSGGMGRVYLARDLLHQRDVAIKIVPPPLYGPGPAERARSSYQRFVREARMIRALDHPGIIRVLEFHESEGLLVMEYLAGGALSDRPFPLPTPLCRGVLLQILDGLQAAHTSGVIHRDIKPQNIFLSETLEARLGDFGVAHLLDLGATLTAGFVGTLAYMAPEQISGHALTFATDIYGLGVTAFQMATGRLPFGGPDFVTQHLSEAPSRPTDLVADLPAAWDALCLTALAKDPAARFQSLDQMRRAVEALPTSGEQWTAVPAGGASPASQATPEQRQGQRGWGGAGGRRGAGWHGPQIETTPHSALYLCTDGRLGRQVIVERFAPGALAGHEEHRRWVRAMARLGGPSLQRVLHIDLEDEVVVFEHTQGGVLLPGAAGGPRRAGLLSEREHEVLRRLLSLLHRDAISHGAVSRSLVREEWAPVLLLGGRGPLWLDHRPGPEHDLEDLAAFTAPKD